MIRQILFTLMMVMGFAAYAADLSSAEKAFLAAVNDGNTAAVKKAFKEKINVNVQDEKGESALIKAVANDNEDMAISLLRKKANVNLKDREGNTAVFYAVSNKNEKMTAELIKAHADLTQVYGEKKESLLFEAARANAAGSAKLLLQKEPGLAAMLNMDGQNALFAAAELGNLEVTKELVKKLNPKLKDKSGKTPVDVAQAAGFAKTVEALSSVSH